MTQFTTRVFFDVARFRGLSAASAAAFFFVTWLLPYYSVVSDSMWLFRICLSSDCLC